MPSVLVYLLFCFALSSCSGAARDQPPRDERPPEPSRPTEEPAAPAAPPTADALAIPAGVVRVGSLPGRAGRDAALEADEVPIELGPFRIDRRPYPSRAEQGPRTAVSRSQAAELCEQEGKRLCTELEWERACDEGELELSGGIAEWTSSSAGARFGASAGLAVVRAGDGEARRARCATRAARSPGAREDGLGFRCCAGDVHEVPYPSEPARRTFRQVDVPVRTLRAALAGIPELERFAASFEPFDESDVSAVFTRGRAEPQLPDGIRRANEVLEWAPRAGELAWIVAGRSSGSSVLAVLYPLPDGSYAHAASMILEADPLSILVTYLPGNARSVAWTSCYGCDGEGGEIQYRDDGRIVIVQH